MEASAGTGKTYAIASLYTRLIVEAGLSPAEILVVTFTNAAAEELRGRIRKRLVTAREAFQTGDSEDSFCRELLEQGYEQQQSQRRLNSAVIGFDEAAIFTIHGFCQRALTQTAFASAMPLETELLTDESELQMQIAEDFWRVYVSPVATDVATWLLKKKQTPGTLLKAVRPFKNRLYITINSVKKPESMPDLRPAFEAARSIWLREHETIGSMLIEHGGLNKSSYKPAKLLGQFASVGEWLVFNQSINPPPEKWELFTQSTLVAKTNKGKFPPIHPFFNALDEVGEVLKLREEYFAQTLRWLRFELLNWLNEKLVERKKIAQVQGYDDLLNNLYGALNRETDGDRLAAELRKRYPAALIDEFQDTDPVQYGIFSKLYLNQDKPVFLVGDPKQAIYKFRGADIYTYLQARGHARQQHNLATNYRSEPTLIKAINHIFTRRGKPFREERITYQNVEPPPDSSATSSALFIKDDATAPLHLWHIQQSENLASKNGLFTVGKAKHAIWDAIAAEVSRLLTAGQNGTATIRDGLNSCALNGGDIAILVRTNQSGRDQAAALRKLGIPSITRASEDVFSTPEALWIERLLIAISEPRREEWLRAALASDILGYSASALDQMNQNESEWESLLFEMQQYKKTWLERGFMLMFQELHQNRDIPRRMLAQPQGERRYTDLQHVTELLHQHDNRARPGLEGLIAWLGHRRAEAHSGSEADPLRLETDAQLVQIVTVHKSKGLEYPIVFCPELWPAARNANKETVLIHDPDQANKPVLDFSESNQKYLQFANDETMAEDLRLAYVALTRAKYRCYVVWGEFGSKGDFCLDYLFDLPEGDPVTREASLKELAATSDHTIALYPMPQEPGLHFQPPAEILQTFRARKAHRGSFNAWRLHSFSGLIGGQEQSRPDHDSMANKPDIEPEPYDPQHDVFGFPRGAKPGTFLHAVFEYLDFTKLDTQTTSQLIQNQLDKHGFERHWESVVQQMVNNVLNTQLDASALTLASIERSKRLDELEFLYPTPSPDSTAMAYLIKRFYQSLPGWDPAKHHIPTLPQMNGYMRGFIDLIFESEGRFYVADYKSNWLGGSIDKYHTESLLPAMLDHHYPMQYLIYTLALHRHLKLRLPDYDYDNHYGGSYYLFLRGMNPDYGNSSGVFFHKPDRDLIIELDATIEGKA